MKKTYYLRPRNKWLRDITTHPEPKKYSCIFCKDTKILKIEGIKQICPQCYNAHPVSKNNPKAKTAVSKELDEIPKIMTAKEIYDLCGYDDKEKFVPLSEVEKLRDEIIKEHNCDCIKDKFDSILQGRK